jgi:ATP-dependent 26S proteasome regulatory subunit
MRVPLEITFGKSPAAHYGQAVKRAQAFAGYQRTGEGQTVVHTVKVTLSLAHEATWEKLHQLLKLVFGWRSTRVTVAGQVVRYGELAHRLAQVRTCFARKVRHGAGPGYCSGKRMPSDEAVYFGCRFCQGISRQVDDQDSWIQFGALSASHDSFRVNKAAILKTLEQQTRADGCLFCPAFRWQHVRADVDDLPEVIELGKDSLFEVKTSALNPKKALGIQPKKASEEEDWVFPLDREARAAESAPMRNVPSVHYADIAGQDAALEQLKNVVELPLTHRSYFEALRVEPQSGVLLYGPPGNGKTLLAKAVATESNAHFELISGPEVLSKWVGESEANLRKLFARARQLAPSVVLIDELDSIAPRRDRVSQHHDVQVLSQLLVLLDGLEARGPLAIVATSNRLEAIDPALRRPGRFDYHIEVPVPDYQGRLAILQVCLAKMKTRGHLRMHALAEATAGYSGAELAALCREAGLQAIRRGLARGLAAQHLFVSRQDLQQALVALRAKRFSSSYQPENSSLDLPGIGSTSPTP